MEGRKTMVPPKKGMGGGRRLGEVLEGWRGSGKKGVVREEEEGEGGRSLEEEEERVLKMSGELVRAGEKNSIGQ